MSHGELQLDQQNLTAETGWIAWIPNFGSWNFGASVAALANIASAKLARTWSIAVWRWAQVVEFMANLPIY
jgi:hypothetical protein